MILSGLNFVSPGWLVVGVIAVLAYCFVVAKKQRGQQFYFTDLIEKDYGAMVWSVVRNGLVGVILLCIAVVLAQPSLRTVKQDIEKEGIDIVVALDISYSMQANDFSPNRISVAKDVLQQFVERVETDRVGVVVFAGKPFTSVPLTFDYEIVTEVLKRTSTSTINQNVSGMQGTAVGDALLSSLTLLEKGKEELSEQQREKRQQIVILLTDGEANVGVDPVVVSQLAQERGVKVYTVGIGSLKGGIITYKTMFGTRNQQVPGVDETSLQQIADNTDAAYRRATDDQTFRRIFEEIAGLEKTKVSQENVYASRDLSGRFLFAAVLCTLIMTILSLVWPPLSDRRVVFLQRVALFAVLACLCFSLWMGAVQGGKTTQGRLIMVMMDVSTSMEVEDIVYNNSFVSRLTTAKTIVERLTQEFIGSKLGLGVFAGETVGVVPLTTNKDFIVSMLGSLDARALTVQGTDVLLAVDHAIKRFDEQGGGTVLLLTDGGDEITKNIGSSIKKIIEEQGIDIVIGHLGTAQGGPIPVGRDNFGGVIYKQYEGQQVISGINKKAMQALVDDSGGRYRSVGSIDDIDELMNELKKQQSASFDGVLGSGWSSTRVTKGGAFGAMIVMLIFIFVQTQRWSGRKDI